MTTGLMQIVKVQGKNLELCQAESRETQNNGELHLHDSETLKLYKSTQNQKSTVQQQAADTNRGVHKHKQLLAKLKTKNEITETRGISDTKW